tara:strand:+ start:335 stop:868 length:534 start_codon:yes stop_codon:yes gene_type:complete
MEQKSYKMEIIRNLLREENHAREIAKNLKINHMMINRKLAELRKENIVDFDIKGKNKVYFLKKSLEAEIFKIAMEEYFLMKTLDKYPKLRKIIEKVRNERKIKLAILFGSYAKQNPGKDSDIDIFIESKDRNVKRDIEQINSKINVKLGEYDKNNNLIKEIDKNHIIIKGFEEYYEK